MIHRVLLKNALYLYLFLPLSPPSHSFFRNETRSDLVVKWSEIKATYETNPERMSRHSRSALAHTGQCVIILCICVYVCVYMCVCVCLFDVCRIYIYINTKRVDSD